MKRNILSTIAFLAAIGATAGALHFRSAAEWQAGQTAEARQEVATLYHEMQAQLAKAEQAPVPNPVTPPPVVDTNELHNLRIELASLQEGLRARDETILALRTAATNQVVAEPQRPWQNEDWLETMKERSPERYAEIMEGRRAAQEEMRESLARKSANLLNKEYPDLAEEEQQERAVMISLVRETWGLVDQMDAELDENKRREIRGQIRDRMIELNPLLEKERNRQYMDIAHDIGYQAEEGAVFVDYLNEINNATSMGDLWRNLRGGGGRWGGGDRGGPGGDSNNNAR